MGKRYSVTQSYSGLIAAGAPIRVLNMQLQSPTTKTLKTIFKNQVGGPGLFPFEGIINDGKFIPLGITFAGGTYLDIPQGGSTDGGGYAILEIEELEFKD